MMNLSLIRKQTLSAQREALPRCQITHANDHTNVEWQTTLLTRLAALSHANTGWILIANAPGRLCRHTLATAGINPACIVDAHRLNPSQLQMALASPAIAAVVCWQQQDETFFPHRQENERLFVIEPAVPASLLH